MRVFLDLPIRKKLTVVIVLANIMALGVVGTASVLYNRSVFEHAAAREAFVQADLIASVCLHPLLRSNPAEAHDRLLVLQDQNQIASVELYDGNNHLLTEFHSGEPAPSLPRPSLTEGYRVERGYVSVIRPLTYQSRQIGTLVLHARTDELSRHLQIGLDAVLVALLISTILALLLAVYLHRAISGPIQDLAHVVDSVEKGGAYSMRVRKTGNDEIGSLIDGVNGMLDQIQQHERELQTSEELFRQVTESIDEIFWMTDVERKRFFFVSHRYDEIWGRPRSKLETASLDWLEAVHPDDRERVRRSVLNTTASGTYDEEFRILRPDGSMRWIRDRAFPVRDGEGKVFRLAGIAEDVTERKRLEQEVLEISDREQERIGQDLHDGICQQLAGIAMTASLLKRRLTGLANPEARVADRMCQQLEDAIASARNLARGISALDVAEDNLSPALRAMAATASREYGVQCRVDYPEPISFPNPNTVTNLYRIAREATFNAAKHGHPNQICLELKPVETGICLKVWDDGVGIENPPKNGSGMGLGLMQYRASLMGAELRIERSPNGVQL